MGGQGVQGGGAKPNPRVLGCARGSGPLVDGSIDHVPILFLSLSLSLFIHCASLFLFRVPLCPLFVFFSFPFRFIVDFLFFSFLFFLYVGLRKYVNDVVDVVGVDEQEENVGHRLDVRPLEKRRKTR